MYNYSSSVCDDNNFSRKCVLNGIRHLTSGFYFGEVLLKMLFVNVTKKLAKNK